MKVVSSQNVWARWGLLASTFVMGAALIIASWANYRSARNATAALHHGQAGVLLSPVRHGLHGYRPGTDGAPDLEQILSERTAEGLRYVALLDEAGRIERSAGTPSPEPLPELRGSGEESDFRIMEVGSRVRVILSFRPPRPPDGPQFERGGPEAPPGGAAARSAAAGGSPPDSAAGRGSMEARPPRPDGPRPGGLVIEFEPLVASDLMDRATRLRAFGLAAAAVMMLVAVFFWRMSRRYESALARIERERRLSLLGEMTAVLAHEIRNPLASLKGNAQLLAERLGADSADRRKADRVVTEASRLEALTTDLLDFARTGPLDLAPVDPAELLRASAQEVAPEGFDLDSGGAPASWTLDARRMRQALTNLLRNAHQATDPGRQRPLVRIGIEEGALVLAIRDHGPGLPQGQEKRVFDPFFTTRASGTGLGLAVARRIVELHGGSITAENHPEGGALLTITLPAGQG